MPRNKSAKRTVKRNKTATTHPALTVTHKIEMEFIGIPAKLASQLHKEIAALKQKEAKLKQALIKIKSQTKNWEKRIKSANAVKHTVAGKKQLNAAKKALVQVKKEQVTLAKTLEQTTQTLQILINKQARFNALTKILKQFDKEWAKKAKIKKQAKKTKAKRAAKSKVAPEMTEASSQPDFESLETTSYDNNMRLEETAEIVS